MGSEGTSAWAALASLLVLAALLVLASGAHAEAQELAADQQEEARGLFDAARAAFAAGRYEDALDYFERSYEITHLPEILYNIGHTAERVRHDERALAAFEQYLELVPAAEERAAIESRIRVLRASVEERRRNEEAQRRERARGEASQAGALARAEPDPTPTSTRPRSSPSEAGWVVLGVGGAVAVGGAVLLGVGSARADEVRSASEGTPWPEVRQAYADADAFAIAGGVLLGVGAAAIAVGAVWGIVDLGGADAAVAIGPGRLELRGSF